MEKTDELRRVFFIITKGTAPCNHPEGVGNIKISALEKLLLGVTAAFLLLTFGYFWGTRSTASPYRVDQAVETPVAEPAGTGKPKPTAKININTATAEELETLPGIGEKRAADIVADREANGPFRIVEELTRVSGSGEGTLEGLIDYITVE